MTIDIDLSTELGQVRAIIGDASEPYQISNNTINGLLLSYSVAEAAMQCVKFLVAYYARAVDQETGDVRRWYSQRYKQYRDLLEDMENDPSVVGVIGRVPIFGGTSKTEKRRVEQSPERVCIGAAIGEFSSVSVSQYDATNPYFLRR